MSTNYWWYRNTTQLHPLNPLTARVHPFRIFYIKRSTFKGRTRRNFWFQVNVPTRDVRNYNSRSMFILAIFYDSRLTGNTDWIRKILIRTTMSFPGQIRLDKKLDDDWFRIRYLQTLIDNCGIRRLENFWILSVVLKRFGAPNSVRHSL